MPGMPESVRAAIAEFLAQKRIAVVGVGRDARDFNRKLFEDFRARGYDAVPVNPKAADIGGVRCYDSVRAIQPPVEGVLVMTPPRVTESVVQDCQAAGVRRVWLYRAGGQGAVSPAAVEFCRSHGMAVIPGACPFMFFRPTPWFHRFHGALLKLTGKYPR